MPEVQETQIVMRKVVTVKLGDLLTFDPHIEALAGPEASFFRKYAGMKACVTGFDEDDKDRFYRMLRSGFTKEPPQVVTHRFRVKFENGDEIDSPLNAIHFIAP